MKKPMLPNLFFILLLTSVFAQPAKQAQEESPLAQLKPLIGKWRSHIDPKYKDHPMIKRFNPELKSSELVFEWGVNKEVIHVTITQLNRPTDGQNTRFIEGMILWNPAQKKMVMVEYNAQDDLFFEGEYQVLKDKNAIQRTYTVSFPNGKTGKYREQWIWDGPEKKSFEWITESFKDGEYKAGDIIVKYSRVD